MLKQTADDLIDFPCSTSWLRYYGFQGLSIFPWQDYGTKTRQDLEALERDYLAMREPVHKNIKKVAQPKVQKNAKERTARKAWLHPKQLANDEL